MMSGYLDGIDMVRLAEQYLGCVPVPDNMLPMVDSTIPSGSKLDIYQDAQGNQTFIVVNSNGQPVGTLIPGSNSNNEFVPSGNESNAPARNYAAYKAMEAKHVEQKNSSTATTTTGGGTGTQPDPGPGTAPGGSGGQTPPPGSTASGGCTPNGGGGRWLYHGSNQTFESFSVEDAISGQISKSYKNQEMGYGIYFTDELDRAVEYVTNKLIGRVYRAGFPIACFQDCQQASSQQILQGNGSLMTNLSPMSLIRQFPGNQALTPGFTGVLGRGQEESASKTS